MKSSYSYRNITVRNTYSNGNAVTCGPDVNGTYPIGCFREDYQYNATSAITPDYLDSHNGRFCVTPEYPNGMYCYFATVKANWNSAYPYLVGPTFYGNKTALKVNSIVEAVTTYSPSAVPSLYIAASTKTICSGTTVNFTSSSYNGGILPSYQWKKNGTNVGSNSNTFSSNSLLNGDVISCVLTTASAASATSNTISMNVTTSVIPSLSIGSTATNICAGTSVTFTATPTNGGSTPFFQWLINGINAGTNGATFISNGFTNGQIISCAMNSNAACVNPTGATSNEIQMNVSSCSSGITLSLKVFIEGFYRGNGTMIAVADKIISPSLCDTIIVELHGASSPQALVESRNGILNIDGTCSLTFSSSLIGNSYYVVIKHRNALETWSAIPVQLNQSTTFDFTTR